MIKRANKGMWVFWDSLHNVLVWRR